MICVADDFVIVLLVFVENIPVVVLAVVGLVVILREVVVLVVEELLVLLMEEVFTVVLAVVVFVVVLAIDGIFELFTSMSWIVLVVAGKVVVTEVADVVEVHNDGVDVVAMDEVEATVIELDDEAAARHSHADTRSAPDIPHRILSVK